MAQNGQTPRPGLPADAEAENVVIGSCLQSADALAQAEPILSAKDFYQAKCGIVYDAMLGLARRGQPVELASVVSELERQQQLDIVGGYGYLADLMTEVASPAHATHYAHIVEHMALRRRLIQASNQIAQLAYDTTQPADPQALVQRAVEALDSALPEMSEDSILYWEESLGRFLAMQMEREVNKDRPRFDWPWPSLNEWVEPLQAGMLATVAAQDGFGKTTWAECVAEYWAKVRGFKVAFFHFELSHGLMLDRRQARRTRTPIRAIQSGMLNDAMHAAIDEMYHWPGQVQYIHCPGWSMGRVAAIARQLVRANKADVVVVDYLGKSDISEYKGDMNTAQRRGADAETLKNLAEREAIPILLMSQLSREAVHQTYKTRHTIRDSGEISEKSNLVVLLDRERLDEGLDCSEYGFGPLRYDAGDYSPVLKVIVDKQTIGKTGQAKLFMLPTFDIVELPAAPSWNARQRDSWRG